MDFPDRKPTVLEDIARIASQWNVAAPARPAPPTLRHPPGDDLSPREQRAKENARNQRKNRKARAARLAAIPDKDKRRQRGINRLTNWQCHQWCKAGRKVSHLAKFAKLPHHRRARREGATGDES